MISLAGQSLTSLPIVGLTRVRDLEYFDGPLLSHFKHERGDHYLYYWCDCNEKANRWMVLRVSEASIIRLVNKFVPLDQVVPKAAQDDFVYFLDIDTDGRISRVNLVLKEQVPQEYLPRPGSYIEPEPLTRDQSYPLLIEGNLSLEQLSGIPTRYAEAYSFLYAVNILKAGQLQSFPWRGGFSSMHFYRSLPNIVPAEHRAAVQALQYASPGFIRFSIHRPTADALGKRIATYLDRKSPEHQFVSRLRSYIAENKLNDLREACPNTNDPQWQKYNAELFSRTRDLLDSLEIGEPNRIIPALGSSFEAAKIVLSFTRRLRELTNFVHDGLIRFPGI